VIGIGIIGLITLFYLMGEPAGVAAAEKSQKSVKVDTASSVANPSHRRRERRRGIIGDPAHHPRFVGQRGRLAPRWARLSQKQIEQITIFAKKYLPEEYQQIELMQQEDPRRARIMLHRIWWLYRRVRQFPPEIRKAAVERHRLNVAIIQTRRDFIKCTDNDEKEKLKAKLRNLLYKQFDYDQAVKEWRVKQLEKQIAGLKAQIERRKNEKDKIIAERLNRLLQVNPSARVSTMPIRLHKMHKNRPPAPTLHERRKPPRK